ncbi:MAG: enoyl-CoA hydratase/isomerase family protein [Deltaproteobacteria bacterium]|nr:enoyl-CoA hydratase/isomerase family protein [Deltaproteobacteria bacterium]
MPTVTTEKARPHVTVVRLARPARRNAMSIELCLELKQTLEEVGRDNDCWIVILTGSGPAFCAGLDLKDHSVIPNIDGLTIPRIGPRAIRIYSQLIPVMRHIPQPIIAAINGPAYGGGLCLTLAADLRIAAESAKFNSTGIVRGLTSTELGASWLLPRLVGAAHANDILYTGRIFDAAEALRMGLVSRVVPDGQILDCAFEIAAGMCEYSPYGLQMTKQVIWANLENSSLAAAIELEDRNQILLGMTDNLPESITAYNEKRKPAYTDEPRRGIYPKA